MAVVFSNPSGMAVGTKVVNGAPANIISITARKVGRNPQAQLSNWASRLGGTAHGKPGSLNQYLSGLGIVTGMSGRISESVSTYDGAALMVNVNAKYHELQIQGIAFNQVSTPSSSGTCTPVYGHGLEGVLAYFQDNRAGNDNNAGRWTIVKIGGTKLDCAVTGVSFKLIDTKFNLWAWTLVLLISPIIHAGASSAELQG